jgi:uncharacterized protein YoaH (UPF0181 family)
MYDFKDTPISVVKGAKGVRTIHVTLERLVIFIRTDASKYSTPYRDALAKAGYWQSVKEKNWKATERIRKECKWLKEELPNAMVAGTFASRRTKSLQLTFSNLLVIDIDHLGYGEWAEMWVRLNASLYVVLAFRSSSGDGIKVVVRVMPMREHRQNRADAYLALGLRDGLDDSGSDRRGMCFLAHDPDAYVNYEAMVVPEGPPLPEPEPKPEEIRGQLLSCEKIEELLNHVEQGLGHGDRIKLVASVKATGILRSSGIALLRAWDQEEHRQTYEQEWDSIDFGDITQGTLIWYAQQGGWDGVLHDEFLLENFHI